MDVSRLNIPEYAAEPLDHVCGPVDNPIDDDDIEPFPEEIAECLAGIDEEEIVEFVDVPLVVHRAVKRGERRGKAGRKGRVDHVERVGNADTHDCYNNRQSHESPLQGMAVVRGMDIGL